MTAYSRYALAKNAANIGCESLILFTPTQRQFLRFDGETKKACLSKFVRYRAESGGIPNDYQEVIEQTEWHKYAIDIDYDVDPQEKSTYDRNIRWFREAVRNICNAVFDVFFAMFNEILDPLDIVACESLDPREPLRLSAHIIVQRAIPHFEVARSITNSIIASIDEDIRDLIDRSLYARVHNLRIATCAKAGSVRIKKMPEGVSLVETLICAPCKKIAACSEQPSFTPASDEHRVTQPITARACAIIDEEYGIGAHVLRNVIGSTIIFRRARPTFCTLCSREHNHDNTVYVIAHRAHEGVIYLYEHCRHNSANHKLIGTISEQMDAQIAERIAHPEKQNIDVLKAQVETTITYDEPAMRDFPESFRTLLVRAPMKLGKTKALARFIQTHFAFEDARIVFVSFRRTFSSATSKSFADFLLYTNIKGTISQERVIVQVESLHRIDPEIYGRVDLVVLDESESIIDQFGSSLSMHHAQDFAVFQWLIKNAKMVIAMDAFISTRTSILLTRMRGKEGSCLITNGYKNATDYKYYFSYNYACWLFALHESLRKNEKVVICSNCASEARVISNILEDNFGDIRIKMYTADTPARTKTDDLADVDIAWCDCDVLIYTPTITAGVSFEKIHYDRLFGYFTDKSCSAQVCMQMMGRIRNIAEKSVFIFLRTEPTYLPLSRDEIMLAFRLRKGAALAEAGIWFSMSYNRAGLPVINESDYTEMCIQNIIANNRSRSDFAGEILRYVNETGATCAILSCNIIGTLFGRTPTNQEMRAMSSESHSAHKHAQIVRCTEIANAYDIDASEYQQIMKQKEDRLCAASEGISIDQLRAVQKFEIQRDYKYRGKLTEWHVRIYGSREMRAIFKNLSCLWLKYIENHMDIRAALREIRNGDGDYLRGLATSCVSQNERDVKELRHSYEFEKHRIAHDLVTSIGYKHVFDTTPVSSRVASDKYQQVHTQIKELLPIIALNFVIPRKIKDAQPSFANTIEIAREVILQMYGMSVIECGEYHHIARNTAFCLRNNGTVTISDDPT